VNPRLAVWLVNGLLAALARSTLFPLLWMLSVSFMAPGASISLPTPILPLVADAGELPHPVRRRRHGPLPAQQPADRDPRHRSSP
jgi:ABC-type glycerol-3-phosphate transport system permease component